MRRELILDIITNIPGIGFNEIAKRVDLSNGVVSHYLLQLLKNGYIIKSDESRAKYFVHNIPKKDMKLIIVFRNNTNLKIIKFLLEKGNPVKSKAIAEAIKKSVATVSTSLKKMEREKIIYREIMNENSKLTSDIAYKISNEKFVRDLILRYNMN
tara:strand:+ start:680 stop:1144 length:465 start_codon:yes stop_codon:yes gene_type:complete